MCRPRQTLFARGKSLLGVFGAYEQAGRTHYSLGSVLRWLLYHVAELDLYLGVIPFAALQAVFEAKKEKDRKK